MPRQNRVTPFGEIVAVPERGTFLGNRGILHDAGERILRPWQVKRWLVCELEFRGRHRQVMAPNRYTELFFLDEATAFAAGHRPCFECRRAWFLAFRAAWMEGNGWPAAGAPIRVDALDARLHAERLLPDRSRRTYEAGLRDLPSGTFVTLADRPAQPYLVLERALLAWSHAGYTERLPRGGVDTVRVLTPRSVVNALAAGYAPVIHQSALASF